MVAQWKATIAVALLADDLISVDQLGRPYPRWVGNEAVRDAIMISAGGVERRHIVSLDIEVDAFVANRYLP